MCKKFLFGAILTAFVCMTACPNGNNEVTKASVTTVSENVTSSESTPASETAISESEETDSGRPKIDNPISAVEKYLEELSQSENVTAVELHETRIGQRYGAADKYYESPLAEKFGITEDTYLVPVNVDYYIDYAENSGFQSSEKSDYFIVSDGGQNGFYVVDTFPYDPRDYYGEVKEILTNDDGGIDFYLVEFDGGLGTVKCKNMVWYPDQQKFEVGERIRVNANGGIYGDPPQVDAITLSEENEFFHGE